MCSNPHKLMHRAQSANHSPFLDDYVSAQRCSVDQHRVIANHAIVADVRVSHDEYVTSDFGQPPTLCRPAVDRDVLANLVAVPDLQPGWFALVSYVLRSHANGGERKDSVISPDLGRTVNCDVRHKITALAEFYIRPDDAIRPDLARRWHPCARMDNGRRMYVRCCHESAAGIAQALSVFLCALG